MFMPVSVGLLRCVALRHAFRRRRFVCGLSVRIHVEVAGLLQHARFYCERPREVGVVPGRSHRSGRPKIRPLRIVTVRFVYA